jgi:hypothetical protein
MAQNVFTCTSLSPSHQGILLLGVGPGPLSRPSAYATDYILVIRENFALSYYIFGFFFQKWQVMQQNVIEVEPALYLCLLS